MHEYPYVKIAKNINVDQTVLTTTYFLALSEAYCRRLRTSNTEL
jgi:hypothetical protein